MRIGEKYSIAEYNVAFPMEELEPLAAGYRVQFIPMTLIPGSDFKKIGDGLYRLKKRVLLMMGQTAGICWTYQRTDSGTNPNLISCRCVAKWLRPNGQWLESPPAEKIWTPETETSAGKVPRSNAIDYCLRGAMRLATEELMGFNQPFTADRLGRVFVLTRVLDADSARIQHHAEKNIEELYA
ncbi:MAG: hypothetical protein D6712_20940 [Chloroflexi bacterium]|nr:MAG: hypothetical protein D6712_20940 [Chloroflexota bacterium]